MRIIFLHMTMGLVDRGSEISTDLIASKLALKHNVLIISAGKLSGKKYLHQRVYPLAHPPSSAPINLLEKIVFRLGFNQANRDIIHFTKQSLSAIREFDPDIIIPVNGASQLKIIQKAFSQIKTAVFGRAGIGHDDLRTLRATPDLFIALSKQASIWATKYALHPTKVVYIPNPIDLDKFESAKPVKLSIPRPTILTVGALTSYKNVLSVIKAVSYLKVSYLLIGDGEDRDKISGALSKLGNEFSWIRSLTPDEIPAYYATSHIFCFTPDQQEAFGRVYLEAMSSGLPIVASDDPIRRSIIGKSGYYVNPHDPVSIAKGIERAVNGKKKIDYTKELKPYQIKTVISNIEKELYALI